MTDEEWLNVVKETAGDLNRLGFEGSSNHAQAALRSAGCGRAREVVLAAMKLRKGLVPHRSVQSAFRDVRQWEWRVQDLEDQLKVARGRLEEHRRTLDPDR
jgi:hypothetical protein